MNVATQPAKPEDGALAPYADAFERVGAETSSPALQAARQESARHFLDRGFPSIKQEEWRHTNVAPIARSSFSLSPRSGAVDRAALEPYLYSGCLNVVLVDGVLSATLSDELDEALVADLSAALRQPGTTAPALERLASQAQHQKHAFVALNTGLFEGGALVRFARGQVVERPVHLLHVATSSPPEEATPANFPRTLIVAEENCQGTVIETFVGTGTSPYFTCAVSEIVAQQASVLRHFKVQREALQAFHIASMNVHLERSANFSSYSISVGGSLVRNDINAVLDGEGVDCTLNGLYLADDRQHVDHHMWVEHKAPHCDSHELYKGILDGHARAVFNGRIFVHDGAQKTDAKQTNRNLLLSDNALVHSNPQLEIFADDVRCTHGSTIGQLEPDALFYLRSRGLPLDAARSLLVYAFASELVERIECEPVRADLERLLFERLPGGDAVRAAAAIE